jgi:hypothetical protein
MSRKGFTADIFPRRGNKYLDKLFLSKMIVSDPHNGCPTDIHMYIPIPTSKNPQPNVQIWIRNGGGKVLIRFKNCVELADTLRNLADTITSNIAIDEYQHAEDMSQFV